MSGEAIKIAIRVRPFNDTEKGQTCCIRMNETQVFVDDHLEGKEERKFTFDHAMWSYDGFNTEADGYNRKKPDSQYCDQEKCW